MVILTIALSALRVCRYGMSGYHELMTGTL